MKSYKLILVIVLSTLANFAQSTGSMRIEVEVYNGPLSKSLNTQKAELMGTLNVTDEVLKLMVRELHMSQCSLGCFGNDWMRKEAGESTAQLFCQPRKATDRLTMVQNEFFEIKKELENKKNVQNSEGSKTPLEASQANDKIKLSEKLSKDAIGLLKEQTGFQVPDEINLSEVRSVIKTLGRLFAMHTSELPKVNTGIIPASDIFTEEVLAQYQQYFPEKDIYKFFDFNENGKRTYFKMWEKFPVKLEDDLKQVCPVLSDVKANILSTLNYLHWPLDFKRETPAYEPEVVDIYDIGVEITGISEPIPVVNDLLHCQDKLINTNDVTNNGEGVTFKDEEGAQECLTKIAKVGKILTEGAEHWASAQIALLLDSRRARIVVARAAISAAELGNEILARADVIMKIHAGVRGAALLPTSVYLRDSEATDYLNLVDWLEAYPRREKKWTPADRTRMIERLITDNNWSKTNTAFAQGTGENSMVFVKDDIGNWNLKSYENDPGDTLKTYMDLGNAIFDSAISMASKAKSPAKFLRDAAGIKLAGEMGQELLFGTGHGAGSKAVSVVEEQTNERLVEIADNLKTLDDTMQETLKSLQEKLSKFEEQVDDEKKDKLVVARKEKTDEVTHARIARDDAKKEEETRFTAFMDSTGDDGQPDPEEAKKLKEAREVSERNQAALKSKEEELAKFEKENAGFIQEQDTLAQNIENTKKEIAELNAKRLLEPQKALAAIKEVMTRHKASLETMQQNAVAESK